MILANIPAKQKKPNVKAMSSPNTPNNPSPKPSDIRNRKRSIKNKNIKKK